MAINSKKKKEFSLLDQAKPLEELNGNEKAVVRKKLENDLVEAEAEEWDEAALEIAARKAAKDRYLALQNSSHMGDIARRIIAGMKSADIALWLLNQSPHEFHSIETSTLVMQIDSFRKVLMKEIYDNGQEHLGLPKQMDVNPIDMEVIRFKDRAIIVQAMMERAVLLQETRLIKAMSIENRLNENSKEPVMTEQVSQEYDRYMRALERLGAYKKMIGREDDGDSAVRELTHNFKQMQKVFDLMPATSKEEFRKQIESLSRKRMMEEKAMKPPINDTANAQPRTAE